MNEQFFDRDETILSCLLSRGFFLFFPKKHKECFCVILSRTKWPLQRKMVVPCLTSVVYETPLR